MGTFAELDLCICNKSTQPVPFRCTCALLGFHSVTVLTPIRARWWRSRLAGQICQSLVLWQCVWPSVCYLSERCEERFFGGKRTTVCLVSVKVRHWFAWHEKSTGLCAFRAITPVCCVYSSLSHLVCVSQVIILASCSMRRWRSFPSTSWRTRCTGAVLPTTSAWHSCKRAPTLSSSAKLIFVSSGTFSWLVVNANQLLTDYTYIEDKYNVIMRIIMKSTDNKRPAKLLFFFFLVANHFQGWWLFVSESSLWQLWPHLLKSSLCGCQERVSGLARQPMEKQLSLPPNSSSHWVIAQTPSLISTVSLSWALGICFDQFYNITFYICAYLLTVCS